jgi:hypothetical protein
MVASGRLIAGGNPDARAASMPEPDPTLQRRLVRLPQVQVDELVIAAGALGPRDRALVRAVYERGLPLKALAAVGGTRPSRLQHQLRRILKRVRSPEFRAILRERARWSAMRRDIAEGVILQGRGQRDIARQLGVSVHCVRKELEYIKALAEAHRQHAVRRESE